MKSALVGHTTNHKSESAPQRAGSTIWVRLKLIYTNHHLQILYMYLNHQPYSILVPLDLWG